MPLLYEALGSPIGIIVKTNDAERLRQQLYPLRKADPDLAGLAFVISPDNGEDLWILNRGNSNV